MGLQEIFTGIIALISLLALFRPEWSGFLKSKRNKIKITPISQVEVGFANFGPTIGVYGTLKSSKYPEFIDFMSVKIVRVSDNLTHNFDWAIFRPDNILLESRDLKYACGFRLSQIEPKFMNIQFHDTSSKQKIELILNELKDHWQTYTNSVLSENPEALNVETLADKFDLYKAFSNEIEDEHLSLYEKIKEIFYWKPGGYEITLNINTSDPRRVFEEKFYFSLSESESKNLEQNVFNMLHIATIDPHKIPNFAWPRLQSK